MYTRMRSVDSVLKVFQQEMSFGSMESNDMQSGSYGFQQVLLQKMFITFNKLLNYFWWLFPIMMSYIPYYNGPMICKFIVSLSVCIIDFKGNDKLLFKN